MPVYYDGKRGTLPDRAAAEPFFERYAWLDGSPELFNTGDSLATKLEKYSDRALENRRLNE